MPDFISKENCHDTIVRAMTAYIRQLEGELEKLKSDHELALNMLGKAYLDSDKDPFTGGPLNE